MKKTGIMGGTFNPIHNGHLYMAQKAMEHSELDEILWIPNHTPYMKDRSKILDPAIRLKMTELAIDHHPNYRISDMEITRGGNSYTHVTLSLLHKAEPETDFYFITGADTLYTIEKWVDPYSVFRQVTILAIYRHSHEIRVNFIQQIEYLKNKYDARIELIPAQPMDISSTEIRNSIKNGIDVSDMLPEKVYSYIKENGLYIN